MLFLEKFLRVSFKGLVYKNMCLGAGMGCVKIAVAVGCAGHWEEDTGGESMG